MADKEECGLAALEYLRENELYHYDMIMRGNYPERKWAEEAACRLVQHIIAKYGIDRFLTADMVGNNKKVAKLAAVLQYYFNNGKEKTNDYLRRTQDTGITEAGQGERPRRGEPQHGRLGRTGVDPRAVGTTSESDQRSGSHDRLESQFGDDTSDVWSDGSLGLDECITAVATRLANNHRDNRTMRDDAMRAIGGNLTSRRAMSLQRHFDRSTVKRVADLARVLIASGHLSDMSAGEVKRLISAVKNSVGHDDVEPSVQKVMDIMVDNQLKQGERALHELESIRGTKVDARGVEVQGELDPAGAHTIKVFKKARGWEKTDIEERIADAQQRMGSNDAAVADEAALDYTHIIQELH